LIVWIDAQISPYLARWLSSRFDVEAKPVRELGLREAKDRDIFLAAREAEAVVLTKDSDFVLLLEQLGPPPQVLWLTVGNTSNARLKEVLSNSFPIVQSLLHRGEPLVEISEAGGAVS
jgi:predicted nuclease of predicted toxin-antitoxin system